jgi:hypothetical protein
MASEIRRDTRLANFRPSRGLKPKRQNSRWRDQREGMDDKHLAALRKAPCCSCLKTPAGTVHHLKSQTKERGISVRSTDRWGVPLCFRCHQEIENAGTKREIKTFQGWGIADVHALALALWGTAGDVSKMVRIIIEHRGTDS